MEDATLRRELLGRITNEDDVNVLRYLCERKPVPEIIKLALMSERRVYKHIRNIYELLEIHHLPKRTRAIELGKF